MKVWEEMKCVTCLAQNDMSACEEVSQDTDKALDILIKYLLQGLYMPIR